MKQWIFGVFARKAIISIGKAIASYLTAGVIADQLAKNGVTIDPNRLQEGLTVLGLAGLKFIEDRRDLAKQNKEEEVKQ